MKKRNYTFDYIRVIAIFAILLCHFLILGGINDGVGRYLGGGGNMVFFSLPALLYGMKWEEGGKEPFKVKTFLTRRIIRIGSSLWPFLLVILLLYIVFDISFSKVNYVVNFVFGGYLAKIPRNEHLWFLTILMVVYIEIVLLSRYKLSWPIQCLLLLLCFVGFVIMEMIGIPGHSILTLGACAVMFLNARQFLDKIMSMNILVCIVGFIVTNVISIYLFDKGLFDTNRIAAFTLLLISGLTWLVFSLRIIPSYPNKIVFGGSNISYEMYLVHYFILHGLIRNVFDISVGITPCFLILLVESAVCAWLLNMVSKMVSFNLEVAAKHIRLL